MQTIWCGQDYSASSFNSKVYSDSEFIKINPQKLLIEGLSLNITGEIGSCSVSDEAYIRFLQNLGVDFKKILESRRNDKTIVFNFTSRRKKKSIIVSNTDNSFSESQDRLYTLGASEIVLNLCTHYFDQNGNRVELTQQIKEDIIENVIEKYGREAMRSTCLAFRDLEANEGGSTHEDNAVDGVNKQVEMNGLTCIAIICIRDEIRPEVPNAIEMCKNAGIRVRMVTGDNKISAIAIAKI